MGEWCLSGRWERGQAGACWLAVLLVMALGPLPLRADPGSGGLYWQLEAPAAPAGSLVWVEDTEDWPDLPRQVPLVLRELESVQVSTSTAWP